MAYTASAVVKEARRWVGYHEKASGKSLKSKTANAGGANYTYFGKVMHRLAPETMDYPAAWCDCFVDYCHYIAAGRDAEKAQRGLCGGFDDYTVASADMYKAAGRWRAKPKKGAQVFFQNSGGICHTGIVEKCSKTTVTTIEGNSGDMVKRHVYSVSNPRIAGYGYPRYDKIGLATVETPEVQSPPAGIEHVEYVVTARSGLNFRTGPGLDNPVMRAEKLGTTVMISETRDGWGQTDSGDWACMDYLDRADGKE